MYTFLIIIHVIVSLFLIAVILLQAGRGGGLADSFGGSQMQNLFGTKSATVLTRATAICAAVFILTCLSLAIISGYRSKSLIERINIPLPAATAPVEPETGSQTGQETKTPVAADTQGEANEE